MPEQPLDVEQNLEPSQPVPQLEPEETEEEKQERLAKELRDYLVDLAKLARDHHMDAGYGVRRIQELQQKPHATFAEARAQRLADLRHYRTAYASQYAHNTLAELGEPYGL